MAGTPWLIFMKIRPLSDHIVIEPLKDKPKKGGIILPETADKERSEKGKVIAVGPGKINKEGKYIPIGVKKGDTVMFTKYAPNEVKIDGKEYLVVRQDDLLAILDK